MSNTQQSGLVLIQDPSRSLADIVGDFAGLPPATLRIFLDQATTALHGLLVTGQPTTASYNNGQGYKSVTYSRTNEMSLRNHIRELKSALRIGPSRRALRIGF